MHQSLFTLLVVFLTLWITGQSSPILQIDVTDSALNVSTHAKRWYGVPVRTEQNRNNPPEVFAWPATCPDPVRQPIRYCWKNQRSYDNLKDILTRAIAKWAHAMDVSSMRIQLDGRCNGVEACICVDDVHTDALFIEDISKDDGSKDTSDADCYSESTPGYKYIRTDLESHPEYHGRHTMKFCDLRKGADDWDRHQAVRVMMHELGHVIGLQHEHQRPDRDDFLIFRPENLNGYEEAKTLCHLDEEVIFDDDEDFETNFKSCCQDSKYACYYFKQALGYIRGDKMRDHQDHPGYTDVKNLWRSYEKGSEFDYDSIMMYNSGFTHGKLDNPILQRKDGGYVFMGGNQDPDKTSISRLDIQRVAQLYSKDVAPPPAKRDVSISTKPLIIEIPHLKSKVWPPGRCSKDGINFKIISS